MFYAHSENKVGKWETVLEHLNAVAKLCREFTGEWSCEAEGEITGLFHDVGKYTDNFQKVLKGNLHKIDHATPGAAAVLYQYGLDGIASAIAAQGHHDGLQSGHFDSLKVALSMKEKRTKFGKTYSSTAFKELINILLSDCQGLPHTHHIKSEYVDLCKQGKDIPAMLYIRMLFSALVDADYLATEAHFEGDERGMRYREKARELNPDCAIKKLFDYKAHIERSSKASTEINQLRKDLFDACYSAGEYPKGIFTLSAPTGAGKTLAMLAFALNHAKFNNKKRIIIVLPFLNIIEQTARIYREILGVIDSPSYVLEDHSLTELSNSERARLFSENWDSPIIITTTVKFFESLFSNRPTECRKLHNIANSIVIFDEAQTMPAGLTLSTLNTLTTASSRFGCSIVFSTATQPAYESLNRFFADKAEIEWQPKEIVPADLRLFERSRRVKPVWHMQAMSFDNVSEQVAKVNQVLVIVNLRRHAQELYSKVSALCSNFCIYHLSTYMCPAHRIDVLKQVREQLSKELPCRLISTQCVEAGVDLDFPVVWRAMAPLEAVIQAAGRCNRNGKGEGIVNVFIPEPQEDKYPGEDYKRGAVTLKGMLMDKNIDLCDTEAIYTYYKKYFEFINIQDKSAELNAAITNRNFEETERHYHWIPSKGINVLVPFSGQMEQFENLKDEALNRGFSREWAHAARQLCVNVIVNSKSQLKDYITEVMIIKNGKEREGTGFYVLLNNELYSEKYGLDVSCTRGEDFFTVI